jgi:hypothetical protein
MRSWSVSDRAQPAGVNWRAATYYFFIVPPGEVASPLFSAEPAVPAPWVLASFEDGIEVPVDAPVVPFFIALPPAEVVLPFMESPVVVLLAAGPPAAELPPAVFPLFCAKASALESTKAVARAIVLILMTVSSFRPHKKQ